MTDFGARPTRHHGRSIVAAVALLFAGAFVVVWSWNSIAVDLFAAPAIDFRHAVAAELTIAVFAAVIGLGIRLSTGLRRHGGAVS